VSAVDYPALTSSAANVIQPNWTSCATIVGVEAWNCTLVDKHANVMKDFKNIIGLGLGLKNAMAKFT